MLFRSGTISKLFGLDDRFYYFDATTNNMNLVEKRGNQYYLESQVVVDEAAECAVLPEGGLLWLDEGKLWRFVNGNVEVQGLLYPSAWSGRFFLVGPGLAISLVRGVLYALFCGERRRYLSLMMRKGFAVALLCAAGLGAIHTLIPPLVERQAVEGIETAMAAAAGLSVELLSSAEKVGVSDVVESCLAKADLQNAEMVLYSYASNGFLVEDSNTLLEPGVITKGNEGLLKVNSRGVSTQTYQTLDGDRKSVV